MDWTTLEPSSNWNPAPSSRLRPRTIRAIQILRRPNRSSPTGARSRRALSRSLQSRRTCGWLTFSSSPVCIRKVFRGFATGCSLSQAFWENTGTRFFRALTRRMRKSVRPRGSTSSATFPLPLGTLGDPWQFLLAVRRSTILRSPRLGVIPAGSLLAAKGLAAPLPGLPALESAVADAVLRDFRSRPRRDRRCSGPGGRQPGRHRKGVPRPRSRQTIANLQALRTELDALAGLFKPRADGAAAAPAGQRAPGSAARAPAPASAPGEIATREQVIESLDRICRYYDQFEPASPLPFLLRRARRLVGRNFLEVMSDLAPDSLNQVRLATGVEPADAAGGQSK